MQNVVIQQIYLLKDFAACVQLSEPPPPQVFVLGGISIL